MLNFNSTTNIDSSRRIQTLKVISLVLRKMENFVSKGILLLFLHLHLSVGTTSTGSFDTWSWVALNPGTDRVAEWVSPFNTQVNRTSSSYVVLT